MLAGDDGLVAICSPLSEFGFLRLGGPFLPKAITFGITALDTDPDIRSAHATGDEAPLERRIEG